MNTSLFSGTPFESFKPVTEPFIRDVIQMSVPKTCELNPIPTQLLCENLDVLFPTITKIMNHFLTTGTVSSDFKTAIVKPFCKETISGLKCIEQPSSHFQAALSV